MRAVMDGFGRKSSSVLPCHTHPNIVFARLDWVSVKSGGSSLQGFFWGGGEGGSTCFDCVQRREYRKRRLHSGLVTLMGGGAGLGGWTEGRTLGQT